MSLKGLKLVLASLCVSVSALAQEGGGTPGMIKMDETAITAAFSGKTHEGFYSYNSVRTGEQAYDETYNADGTLNYNEGMFTDTGTWWVDRHQLCHSYSYDPPEMTHCFYIYRKDRCYYFYSSYLKTTGLPIHARQWNNRSIIHGESKTCELPIA